MAERGFPFDSGEGANVLESDWREMARNWLATGVFDDDLNKLQPFADSTGMQAKVRSGKAWVVGHHYLNDNGTILPIVTADPTNPRIDLIVLRADFGTNLVRLRVVQGTPAASPAAPPVTRNTSVWEVPIGQVRVNAGATTIAAGDVTDVREYARPITDPNMAAVQATDDATVTTTQTAYVALSGGPVANCRVPASGKVLVIFGAEGWREVINGSASMTIEVIQNGVTVLAPSDARRVHFLSPSTSAGDTPSRAVLVTGLQRDREIAVAMRYRTSAGTSSYRFRWITAIPVI